METTNEMGSETNENIFFCLLCITNGNSEGEFQLGFVPTDLFDVLT